MNKLIDLVYIFFCLYYFIPIMNKLFIELKYNSITSKVFFVIVVFSMEIIFYTIMKYLRKNKINILDLMNTSLMNTILYLLGFSLIEDLNNDIDKFINTNNKEFTYLIKIMIIITPNLLFSILKPLLKPY